MELKRWIVAATLATVVGAASGLSAQNVYWTGTHDPNLMQQYYTQGGASAVTAAMYPAPHPVPTNVGYSFNTYQPLMPHEMLWTHSRNYYNYYGNPPAYYSDPCRGGNCGNGGGALNVTSVRWQSGCNHMGHLATSLQPFAKLQYGLQSRYYGINGSQGHLGGRLHGIGHGHHLGGRLHGHHGASCNVGDCGHAGGCNSCQGGN